MDDLNAIQRIVQMTFGKFVASGIVAQISAGKAVVNLGNSSNQQPCSYDPSMQMGIGDRVILIKPPLENLWSIAAVTYRSNQGRSDAVRETPNNRSGSPRFAPLANLSAVNATISSGTAVSVFTQSRNYGGGHALVIFNGYATIASGNTVLTLSAGYDGNNGPTVWNGAILTTVTPINFMYVIPTVLNGQHSVDLFALRTSANVSLFNNQVQILEI